MNKTEMRKQILKIRNNMTRDEKEKLDEQIYKRIMENKAVIEAKNIFIFVSYSSEVDTYKIINELLRMKKNVLVPKIISKNEGMIAVKITNLNDLEKNKYGIPEPVSNEKWEESDIDLVIVPGVAFDLRGGRMGYGGGFYDRFFNLIRSNCKKIGIAYPYQIIESVPMEENDIYIDGIIYE